MNETKEETMTDHKAEAESLARRSAQDVRGAAEMLALAQTHAVLYLAEQQRVANLMQYAANYLEQDEYRVIGAQVRASLGLT